MSAVRKLVVFVVLVSVAVALERAWLNAVEPQIATRVAVEQLNGNDDAFRRMRLFETYKGLADAAVVLVAIAAAWWLASRTRVAGRRWPQVIFIATSMFALNGCVVRPYDRPQYAEIDTSETGLLIPLEGDSNVQAKFQSEEYLRQLKVAAKRVQISHRWSQEGRLPASGRWIGTVRLIKVNRSPVTREWTAEATTGTAAKNRAVWIESADSVGFSWDSPAPRSFPKSRLRSSSTGIRAARSPT